MMEFKVPGMSCGHCVKAVTEAVQAVDAQATVEVDLGSKQVKVESAHGRDELVAALVEAGYQPS